jgi:hypothetical protein
MSILSLEQTSNIIKSQSLYEESLKYNNKILKINDKNYQAHFQIGNIFF